MITWGRWYWPDFLIAASVFVVLGFGIPELIALLTQVSTHTDNTLSNYSWQELHVTTQLTRHTIAWYVSFITWLSAILILTLHIWFHQFSGGN